MFTGEAELLGSKMVSPFAVAQPSGECHLRLTKEPHPDIPRDCVFPVYHILPVPRENLAKLSETCLPLLSGNETEM